VALSKLQIGRCGELLVQYTLLLRGIESAPMSTDAGIDLVAYSPTMHEPLTIQVKANLKPKPGGGKGKAALDWWLPHDSPAKLIALVDLSSQRIWLFETAEIPQIAQQETETKFHIYMYTDPTHRPKKAGRLAHAHEFGRYLLENRSHEVFGV
jgi:hypothetical protein